MHGEVDVKIVAMNVICYVDGFNLYHGLRSCGWKRYYWLDLWGLAERFLHPEQRLVRVNYYTSLIKQDSAGERRQLDYIDALRAIRPRLTVCFGHYLAKRQQCRACGLTWMRPEEKMTDVNIACDLLLDAADCRFDVALLVSGDSDLIPPIRAVRARWPSKKVIAVFPPQRSSEALRRAANGWTHVGEDKLRKSQLPERVRVAADCYVARPADWA